MVFLIIALVLVLLDQVTKYLVSVNIPYGETVSVISGFFDLTYVRNPGSAFSFLAGTDWGIYVLIAISAVASLVFLYLLLFKSKKFPFWLRVINVVLLAGTLGNFIDRVRYRSVVDFLQFTFGSYVFPIFNVADICVVLSTIGLALFVLFDKEFFADKKKDSDSSEKHEEPASDEEVVEGISEDELPDGEQKAEVTV